MVINKELKEAISRLNGNHNFDKIIKFLEDEYEVVVSGLIKADNRNVNQLQGKAILLKELIKNFKRP